MLLSIFVLGTEIRNGINPSMINQNFIFLAALITCLAIYRRRLLTKDFVIVFLLILHCYMVDYISPYSNPGPVIIIKSSPLLLFAINYSSAIWNYKKCAYKYIKVYNLFAYLLLAIWATDCVTNGLVTKSVVLGLCPNLSQWVPASYGFFQYRYSAYIGQSLAVSEVFLIFFALNQCYAHKTKEYICPEYLMYTISFLGVLATGSKTGIVIVLAMLVYSFLKGKNKGVKFAIIFILGSVLVGVGSFTLVANRFSTTELTTGRGLIITEAFERGILQLKLLTGTGSNLINAYAPYLGVFRAQIINEYPFFSMLFQYGLIHVLLVLYIIIYKPVMNLLKNKNGYIAVFLLLIFLDVNTFNWYLAYTDAVLLFVLTNIMLQFVSMIPEEGRE